MLTSTSRGRVTPAQWARTIKRSALREMLELVMRPNLTSFALGLPAPELLPLASYGVASSQALSIDPQALQYQMPSEPLKRHIQELLASRGVNCRPEQIFLTSGAQQAIHLLVNLLVEHGQEVLVEEVTYEGLHMALEPLRPQVLTVPASAETGIDLDAVEAKLIHGARPAFIYTVTDGQNPLGLSLSPQARLRLVELARRFCIPIIEDDVFGFLNYDGPALSPMRAMDDEWVFYIGSFSKILAPASRVGWVVTPEAFKPALSFLKQASDLDITTLAQLTVSAYLDTGELPGHLTVIRREYGRRRDLMLGALESHFPEEARWKKPSTGMFIWVEAPPEMDTTELLKVAVETERVAFMPGSIFAPAGVKCGRNGMRLNFTHCPSEQIEGGGARLARALKKSMKRLK
jgi:2-aminoadipate transaminase